jgi:hypothetical protein
MTTDKTNNTGQDDLSHIVKVVMDRRNHLTIRILQAFAIAGIKDVPSLLLLDQQEIENLYIVNADGIEEKLATNFAFVLTSFCVFVSELAENGTKMPVWQDLTSSMFERFRIKLCDKLACTTMPTWQDLTRLMFERFRIEQSDKPACNTSSSHIAPRSEPHCKYVSFNNDYYYG